MMNWHDGWGYMHGFGGFGWLIMIVVWVIVITAIVLVVRWLMSSPRLESGGTENKALSILEERYARGEIDREEYVQKRKDLTHPHSG
jgi:putative membrane protein